MPANYDEIYHSGPHALGEPSKYFTEFFKKYPKPAARVLDMGCGQGRDALFIARRGHHVAGVDTSPVGIKDMCAEAEKDGLNVRGIVADVASWQPDQTYDVILFDRTLHMLNAADRLKTMRISINALAPMGHILISDEKPNLPAVRQLIMGSARNFNETFSDNSRLFVQCDGEAA